MPPTSPDVAPPVGRWGVAWRMVLMLVISGLGLGGYRHRIDVGTVALDAGLGLVAYVLVWWRRQYPMPVAVVTNVLAAVSGIATGPATLAAVSLATRRDWPRVIVVGLISVAANEVFVTVHRTDDVDRWVEFTFSVAVTAAVLAWGMYIGSRRELLWSLRERATRAEAEQTARVGAAQQAERARIAREMHDVLAHRISQISMHAGALAFREDLDPEQVRASATVIRDASHRALTDLRAVLGVLRDDTGSLSAAAELAPQPTYADVAALVDAARADGQRIELVDDVEQPGEVPEAVGRTVYRIVQEGITNARKHAPGAALAIELRGSPLDGLDVVLRNPLGFATTTATGPAGPAGPAVPGSGLGLVGLAERAQLGGGRLVHRRTSREFELRGWIPWPA